MSAGLKPYSAYKATTEPWLRRLPVHWELRRTKALLLQRSEKGRPDEPLLAATQTKGVVRKEEYENRTVLALKDLHLLKVVHVGDFVISLRSFQGGIEYAREQGIISPAYTILYPADERHRGYLARVLKSTPYIHNLSLFVTGIRQGQSIDYGRLSLSYLPLPPLAEQVAIVRFLDNADRRIRRYVRAKQKLIALLEEQKQAIVHRTVTGQIDVRTGKPYPAYKSAGTEWLLGEVPACWEVVRLKFVASKIVDCLHATPNYSEGGDFLAIRTADISPGAVHVSSARRVDAVEYDRWTERLEPMTGDILYSREGERFGIAACVPNGMRLCISQRMMVFRIRAEHNPTFVMWVLNSKPVLAQACQYIVGATAPHVNVSIIRNYRLTIPGRDEQDRLVNNIEDATKGHNAAIAAAKQSIACLEEYRTRLVADVVTGKLDVRAVAARLPETDPLAAQTGADHALPVVAESTLVEPDGMIVEART